MGDVTLCPRCRTEISLPERMRGKYVKCPECRERFFARPLTEAGILPADSVPMASAPVGELESRPLTHAIDKLPTYLAYLVMAPVFLVVIWCWRVSVFHSLAIFLFGCAMCLVTAWAAYVPRWPVPLRIVCVLALDGIIYAGPFLYPWGPFVVLPG